MLDTPSITQFATQLTAVIHFIIPHDEIGSVMRPGLEELMTAIAAQGITPTGPWFNHHLKMAPDTWDFQMSVPVDGPVVATGRVKPGQRPAIKVATAIYHGPYEGLADAWPELLDWIAANGHTPAPDLYECYVAGPESSSHPANWRTELIKPLTR